MPVVISLEEFLEKVPYWPEPGEDYQGDDVHRSRYSPRGASHSMRDTCRPFELKRYRKIGASESEGKPYYARVKYDGEWGYFDGGGGGGGGGGRYFYRANRRFPIKFQRRQERLEKMLDKARLSDYRVTGDWFTAMETFGSDGVLAVREAMDKEPEMMRVLDGWAVWKYGLDKVTDSKSAWKVFKGICDEAEMRGGYTTTSVAHRAVELLVEKLDPQQVADKAVGHISSRSEVWSSGVMIRPPANPVAHAVWMLDELLDSRDDSQTNIIEKRVPAALIYRQYNREAALYRAAYLGGEDIERFLRRHNWRARPEQLPWKLRTHGGMEVNRALFLLANMRGATGRQFRKDQSKRLFEMADDIHLMGIEESGVQGQGPFGFLFIDKELALKYWPRFVARVATERKHYALKYKFFYLMQMEPVSTVEMYVDAWRRYAYEYSFHHEALMELKRLPDDRREQVLAAIEQAIREDVSNIQGLSDDPQRVRDYLLRHIKNSVRTTGMEARDILAELSAGGGEYKGEDIAEWLEHAEPAHPLVKMLAESDKAELQLLVMGAIRAHPTPANREILKRLSEDKEEYVRWSAERIQSELRELANIPVAELADKTKAKGERI
jgi:hypothetical protein